MTGESEQEHCSRFAAGDPAVWQKVLERQIPEMYRMFMANWPNPSLAEELTQQAVFNALRAFKTYNPRKGAPETWMKAIARNLIRLEIRKRTTKPEANGELSGYLEVIDLAPLPDKVLEQKETAEIVCKAMQQLDDSHRRVLQARYLEDLPVKTIAGRMNMTDRAVEGLLYRARLSLREQLRRHTHPESRG